MSKESEEKNEHEWDPNAPHYWMPMTKDELEWLTNRIRVGDTAWLVRAMSAHMRHIVQEISRRRGRSLQEMMKYQKELEEWDNLHAPDNPRLNKEHIPEAPEAL